MTQLVSLRPACLFLVLVAGAGCARAASDEPQAEHDWRSDWSVPPGYALEIHAEGFEMPTALAFVPEPGRDPLSPLYFVTELGGRVRVVLNDRSVHTFAEGFMERHATSELPEIDGETGLAGICLDARRGYVFVTFAHRDESGTLRNGMIRFETAPGVFGTAPTGHRAYDALFGAYRSAISHQIGGCHVSGDAIFVSVADGRQVEESQRTESILGKVLRFHVDGHPLPGNPFAGTRAAVGSAPWVWAWGLRNPFGITTVDGRVFVADNGSGVDRFLEIERGENYLWSGTDASIAARADAVIVPSVGPAQLAWVPHGHPALDDEVRGSFVVAMSSLRHGGVLAIPYGLVEGRMLSAPAPFVRYDGRRPQIVAGVAVGPDGIYFAPILPDARGRSAVYRVRHEPARSHPFLLSDRRDAALIISEAGCLGCHMLGDTGGAVAPALDRDELVTRLRARLASAEYVAHLRELDAVEHEALVATRAARRDVLDAQGAEQLRLWVLHKLLEPRFENPESQMPDPGLSETEAGIVTSYLLREPEVVHGGLRRTIARALPREPRRRHLVVFAVAGFAGGAFGVIGLQLALAHRRRNVDHR